MRNRALIHIAGPEGAGKTTFIERLLEAQVALAICVRAAQASSPKNHAELRRYREAGASRVALYRFAERGTDAFFTSEFMQNYSEAVFIEGDLPDYVDLSVFIAPTLPQGSTLFRRVLRDRSAAHKASLERIEHFPEALAHLLSRELGVPFVEQSELLDHVRHSIRAELSKAKDAPAPTPTEHWALAEGYQGIERAQLVVVNIRSEGERLDAEKLIAELGQLRKDDKLFKDVVGFRGSKLPITAVVADLSNPRDAGLKKAIARIKRATKRRNE